MPCSMELIRRAAIVIVVIVIVVVVSVDVMLSSNLLSLCFCRAASHYGCEQNKTQQKQSSNESLPYKLGSE